MRFKVTIENSELGETEIIAKNFDKAEEKARDWVREGDYSDLTQEEYVHFTVRNAKGEERKFQQVVGGPDEPLCKNQAEHDWRSPTELVGGLDNNPGVFSESNGHFRYEEVCSRCGHYRTTISGSIPSANPAVPERVTYREPDDRSKAWIAAQDE